MALSGAADKYVPFRNAKLTRLLQDSLGGNCKTAVLARPPPTQCTARTVHLRSGHRTDSVPRVCGVGVLITLTS